MAALRKALKKYAKNVESTNQPLAGFLALEVEHPDDPGAWPWMVGWVAGWWPCWLMDSQPLAM